MGSVMDQERPWERYEYPNTVEGRLDRAKNFSRSSVVDQLVKELIRLEKRVSELEEKTR